MKKYMPLEGLRWSRDSGSTLCDTPQNGRSRTGWGEVKENKPLLPSFSFYPACSYPHISVFLSFHPVYILISQILSVPLLAKKEKQDGQVHNTITRS